MSTQNSPQNPHGLLAGKTALITGASRGIGRATALRFGREGALVAVHYNRNRDDADAVVGAITDAGGRAFALQADVSRAEEVRALFDALDAELTARTGEARFDILVNNAGIAEWADFGQTTEEQFDRLFDTNVKGLFFAAQAAVPRLRDGGRIINLSSIVTRTPFPGVLAYAMTKGAVDVLTRHLAALVGERGITVNSLAPGAIDTDMSAWLRTPEGEQMAKSMAAIPRVGTPEDIADAALLLAGDAARWITANYVDASGGAKL